MKATFIFIVILLTISGSIFGQIPSAPDSLPMLRPLPQLKPIPLDGGMKLYVYEQAKNPFYEAQLVIKPESGTIFSMPVVETLSTLIDQGTRKRAHQKLLQQLATMGSHLEYAAGDDRFVLKMRGPVEHASEAVDILGDIATGLSILPNSVTTSEALMQTGIHPYPTNPLKVLDRALRLTSSDVLRMPDIDAERIAVAQVRREELLSFHRTSFRPQHATLVVVGGVSAGTMKSVAKKSFHSWGNGKGQPPTGKCIEGKARERMLWYPGLSSRSAYGAMVFNCGTVSPVAAAELVKQFLLQETDAGNDVVKQIPLSFLQVKSVERPGDDAIAVMFVCPPDRTSSAVSTLLQLIQKRAAAGIAENAVNRVRRAVIGRTMMDLSSVSSASDLLVDGVIAENDPALRFKELDSVHKLTANALATDSHLFDPANCRLLLIGDSASVTPQMNAIKALFP
jgi:predicted Zn-dependent peptidase